MFINNIDFNKINNDLLDRDSIIVVDNFLCDDVANFLHKRMVYEDVFQRYYNKSGYRAKYYDLNQDKITTYIAGELTKKLTNLPLFKSAWSFIYDNKSYGVPYHSDIAILNLNIWVTKNESVNDFSKNGLSIVPVTPPLSWGWDRKKSYGNRDNRIDNFLKTAGVEAVNISYKFNRAIFFNSAFFHKTIGVDMKPGRNNRRVSYTMLFG